MSVVVDSSQPVALSSPAVAHGRNSETSSSTPPTPTISCRRLSDGSIARIMPDGSSARRRRSQVPDMIVFPVPYSGEAEPPDPLPVSSCWSEEREGAAPLALVVIANARDQPPVLSYGGSSEQHCT